MLTAAFDTLGSLPTFAAAAHEINLKLEGEWRLSGQSVHSLRLRVWLLSLV
jgi:hypothetical protein